MIYLLIFFPFLALFVVLGSHSRRILRHYEKSHYDFYCSLQISDFRPYVGGSFVLSRLVGIRQGMSFREPESGTRLALSELISSTSIAEKLNDETLSKIVKRRIRLTQITIAYAGLIPLFIVVYWATILL